MLFMSGIKSPESEVRPRIMPAGQQEDAEQKLAKKEQTERQSKPELKRNKILIKNAAADYKKKSNLFI